MGVVVSVEGHACVEAAAGSSLLEICEAAGIEIEAACGGFACCNTCRVEILDGAGSLSPRLPEEEPFLDAPTQRLACQAEVWGAVAVRLAPGT
ncbi:MAG TPA: (2Fe-2S)-binding protein [Deltaproteobacteria bacterium]|nr:(2Fe-2S)-binding protein [Deltaproteobacteria bacterium]